MSGTEGFDVCPGNSLLCTRAPSNGTGGGGGGNGSICVTACPQSPLATTVRAENHSELILRPEKSNSNHVNNEKTVRF